MCHQGYRLAGIVCENLLQQLFGPRRMWLDNFSPLRLPQLVPLFEVLFNLKAGVSAGDPYFAAPLVARVDTKSFAQLLFNNGRESRVGTNARRECELCGA